MKNEFIKSLTLGVTFILSVLFSSVALAGYLHDPLENPEVLRDVVVAPGNVFGFAPARRDAAHPHSTLHHFAGGDFASFESVGKYRAIRIKYHEYVVERLDKLMEKRMSTAEKAREAVKIRNEARLATYLDETGKVLEGLEKGYRAALKRAEKNTYEYFYEQKGLSDEEIIQSAYGSNPGMDAVLGLYDRHFNAYKILVPPKVIASMNDQEKVAYERLYRHFVHSSQLQRDKRAYLYFLEPQLAKKMIVHLVTFNNY